MSLRIFEQVRFKPACSATEASQNLETLDKASTHIILSKQWTTKVLIRLCRSAGWSAPLLFAYGIRHVFTWPGPFISCKKGNGSEETANNKGIRFIHRLWCFESIQITKSCFYNCIHYNIVLLPSGWCEFLQVWASAASETFHSMWALNFVCSLFHDLVIIKSFVEIQIYMNDISFNIY